MNILIVAQQWFPDAIGGSARVAYEQAKALAQLGHTIIVIAPRNKKGLKERDMHEDMTIYRYGDGILSLLGQSITDVNVMPSCVREVLQKHPDIQLAIAHQPTVGWALMKVAPHIPMLYMFHASVPQEVTFQGLTGRYTILKKWAKGLFIRGLRVIEKSVLNHATSIAVLSLYSKSLVEQLYPQDLSKVQVIATGIDSNLYAPAPSKALVRSRLGISEEITMFLTVRRLVPRMGLALLIEAFSRVTREYPDVKLFIVGEGPLQSLLQKLIEKKSCEEKIMLTGRVREGDLPLWYKSADCFVLSTLAYEGLGIATLEALSTGVPVLGTPIGATPEILSAVDPRLLFKHADIDSMERGLRWFLSEGITEQEIGGKARALVKNKYTWEKAGKDLEGMCGELVKEVFVEGE